MGSLRILIDIFFTSSPGDQPCRSGLWSQRTSVSSLQLHVATSAEIHQNISRLWWFHHIHTVFTHEAKQGIETPLLDQIVSGGTKAQSYRSGGKMHQFWWRISVLNMESCSTTTRNGLLRFSKLLLVLTCCQSLLIIRRSMLSSTARAALQSCSGMKTQTFGKKSYDHFSLTSEWQVRIEVGRNGILRPMQISRSTSATVKRSCNKFVPLRRNSISIKTMDHRV